MWRRYQADEGPSSYDVPSNNDGERIDNAPIETNGLAVNPDVPTETEQVQKRVKARTAQIREQRLRKQARRIALSFAANDVDTGANVD